MIIRKDKQQNLFIGLFIVYVLALTWIILLKFEFGIPETGNIRHINLIPFAESVIINGRISFSEIYMNAIAFIPFGIYCGVLFSKYSFWKKCLPFVIVSFLFEAAQYIFAIGRSDITDLINNSLGGVFGLLIYMGLAKAIGDSRKTNRIVIVFALTGTIIMCFLMALLIVVNK